MRPMSLVRMQLTTLQSLQINQSSRPHKQPLLNSRRRLRSPPSRTPALAAHSWDFTGEVWP